MWRLCLLLLPYVMCSIEHKAVAYAHSGAQQYRKRDPVDADETEFMENIFDALCSALGEAEIKQLFLKSEGVDLMVLLMK